MRILVIEDEVKTAEYVRQGLTECGYVVDCVHTGSDGLFLAKQHEYELIILDITYQRWTVGRSLSCCAVKTARPAS